MTVTFADLPQRILSELAAERVQEAASFRRGGTDPPAPAGSGPAIGQGVAGIG